MPQRLEPERASSAPPSRPVTWGLVLFQFVFGGLWFGVASVLTGEPEIVLTRQANGAIDLDYTLYLFGVIPARRLHLEDVSSELQQSTTLAQSSRRPGGERGPEMTQALTVQTQRWITFTSRDGMFEERLPGVSDSSAVSGFFAGNDGARSTPRDRGASTVSSRSASSAASYSSAACGISFVSCCGGSAWRRRLLSA